jgi:hypothetical protein
MGNDIVSFLTSLLFWTVAGLKVVFPLIIPACMWMYFKEEQKKSKKKEENTPDYPNI